LFELNLFDFQTDRKIKIYLLVAKKKRLVCSKISAEHQSKPRREGGGGITNHIKQSHISLKIKSERERERH